MRSLFVLLATSVLAFGCSSSENTAPAPTPPATETPTPAETAEPAAVEAFELFGEALDESTPTMSFTEVVRDAQALKGKKIITNGTVRASCLKRGCWMEIRPDDERDGVGVTVRFKDYGFFVPLNSRGARVRFEAVVNYTKMTAAQVKEMEAEGGTVTEKNADGTANVVLLMASGVEMRGRKQGTSKN
jgi:hypothetical protein